MKRLNCFLAVLGAAIGAVLLAGCSGGSTLGTEFVQGVVTMDGKPVPEATVMFTPLTEGQGLSATGITDADGVFKLTAANSGGATAVVGSGTLAGEYCVGVIKSVQEQFISEEEAQATGVKYVGTKSGQSPKVTHVVPVKYNKPKTSGLIVTVKEGKNTIPIELTSS